MHRGSTPTFIFDVQTDLSTMTDLSIVFVQDGKIIIEKRLQDVEVDGNTIKVYMTEDETLTFTTDETMNAYIDIQLRFAFGQERAASDILQVVVKPILKEGKL